METEFKGEELVIAHERKVEVTILPLLPISPPKSTFTPQSETPNITFAAQQAPKKPLPTDYYNSQMSRLFFEKILSEKIVATDKLSELNLLITGLHKLIKSPILLKFLYKNWIIYHILIKILVTLVQLI